MNEWRYVETRRLDVITIPFVWLAIVLSLLVHLGALLSLWPKLDHMLSDVADTPQSSSSLAVQLAPQTSAPARSEPAPPPAPSAAPSPPVVANVTPPRRPTP